MKESTESPVFNNVLALIMVLGFFAVVGIMLFHEIPAGSKDMLGPIIGGIIGASVSTIIQYKWGSSAGSAAKSTTIASQMTGTGDGAGTTTTKSKIVEEKVTTKEVTTPPIAAWATGATYKAGDFVMAGTDKFRSLSDHTATTDNQPGIGPNWAELWERQP